MEQNKNELSVNTSVFNGDRDAYCSMPMNTPQERKIVAKALESSDVLLNDCVGESFNLIGVYTEKKLVEKKDDKGNIEINKETGQVTLVNKYRSILFAEDGKTYATGAYGVYASLKSLFFIYGTPDQWESPIAVKVIKKKLPDNKTSLNLEY